jgi:hypothetical protein
MERFQRLQEGIVYRSGARTVANFTPRSGDDTEGKAGEVGLSTNQRLDAVGKPGGKIQAIDLALLKEPLRGFLGEEGHVGIAPAAASGDVDYEQLEEWAACRDQDTPHRLTQLVLDAISQADLRRPK